LESADYEFECSKIVGRTFENVADHSAYCAMEAALKSSKHWLFNNLRSYAIECESVGDILPTGMKPDPILMGFYDGELP